MFDDFLRDWYARHDRAVRGRSTGRRTTTSTSTASCARTACARSSSRAASSCRRARRATRRRPRPCTALGTRKNDLVLELIREQGVEPYEGSVRFAEQARDAGLRRAVVSSSTNCQDVLVAAGIEHLFEVRVDGVVAEREGLRGQARPGHVPGRRRGARRRARARPPCSRTRSPASRRAAPGDFGWVVGVDRTGQAEALRATAPTSSCRTSASCWRSDDRPGRLRGRAVERPRARAARSTCSARRSRSSRCRTATSGCAATSTRASPHGAPGTYLNGFFEVRPLPYAEGGYGYPEDGPDDDQRHERQAHPPARRRRAVRRPLRPPACATSACSTCATACCAARWSGSRRPARPCGSARRGSCPSSSARSRRSATRSSRWTARARIVVQSELVANEPIPEETDDPRAAAALRAPLVGEYHGHHDLRAGARPPHAGERAAHGGGHGPRRRRAARGRSPTAESEPDLARVTVSTELEPGPDAAGGQADRLRLVERALDARAARPGRRRARGGEAHGLGRAAAAPSASTSTTSGTGPTSSSTAIPRCSRRCASRSSRSSRRRPRRAAGDPGQGAHRARLRRPHVLGHGDLHAARC